MIGLNNLKRNKMKYKLINSVTKIETLCDKVTIDGFDYYVSDNPKGGKYIIWLGKTVEHFPKQGTPQLTYGTTIISTLYSGGHAKDWKEIVATNNPNIDIPKVVDEFVSFEGAKDLSSFVRGYNKSQETHPFSEEDIIEFAEWLIKRLPPQYDCDTTTNYIPQVMINDEKQLWTKGHGNRTEFYTTKELLQLWKEQKPKIVYYE